MISLSRCSLFVISTDDSTDELLADVLSSRHSSSSSALVLFQLLPLKHKRRRTTAGFSALDRFTFLVSPTIHNFSLVQSWSYRIVVMMMK